MLAISAFESPRAINSSTSRSRSVSSASSGGGGLRLADDGPAQAGSNANRVCQRARQARRQHPARHTRPIRDDRLQRRSHREGKPTSIQATLAPGTYVVAGDHSHAVFTVGTSASPASLPKPAATVTAIDFAYRGPKTLHEGELVRFANHGYLIHMFQWARAKNAAAASKAEALLQAGNLRGVQRYATYQGAFTGPLSTGTAEQQIITERPGVYVMFCAMTSQDGRQHYQLGMFRTSRIVK